MKRTITHSRQGLFLLTRLLRGYFGVTIFLLLIQLKTFGQTGTSEDPFTALGNAWFVPSSGTYYFDISGTAFSTYVEAGSGWILAASGSTGTSEGSYPNTTSLTLQSDQILPSSIYTSTDVVKVRINATSGPATPFDVETSHASVLTNLQSDVTLSHDNNGSMWTGTGTSHMSKIFCGVNVSLSTGIYHACNNQNGLHWIVSSNLEDVDLNGLPSGENNLNLWIRANSVALPVKLTGFTARKDLNQVSLSWQTASETNNAGFQIQRAADGEKWENIDFVPGHGATLEPKSYTFLDKHPLSGMNYYRLRQTDFDGRVEVSKVVSVDLGTAWVSAFGAFPNPVRNNELILHFPENSEEGATIRLFNPAGQLVLEESMEGASRMLDVSGLQAGIYTLQFWNPNGASGDGRFYEKIVVQK